MDRWKFLCLVGGSVNGYSYFGKKYWRNKVCLCFVV